MKFWKRELEGGRCHLAVLLKHWFGETTRSLQRNLGNETGPAAQGGLGGCSAGRGHGKLLPLCICCPCGFAAKQLRTAWWQLLMSRASSWGDKPDAEQSQYSWDPPGTAVSPVPHPTAKEDFSPAPTPLLFFHLPNFGQVSLLANPNLNHPRNRCLRNTVPCLTELTWHNPTTSQQCNETDIIILLFQKRKQRLVRLYKYVTRSVRIQSVSS